MKNMNDSSEHNSKEDTQADNPLNTSEFSAQIDEIKDVFNRVSVLSQEVSRWSESTLQLFLIEVQRNVVAAKHLLLCQLLFIPLLILFVFSVCVCAGGLAYYFTGNLLAAIGTFLITIIAVLGGLAYWQKCLLKHVGFNDTIAQLEEGVNVIYKAAQSGD